MRRSFLSLPAAVCYSRITLLLLLLAFFPSILAIRDYSIWQVLWDPTINRVKAAAAISDASEHSFHMPLLFFHGASPFGVPNGDHRHHMATLSEAAAARLIWFTLLTCGSLYILIYYCYYNKHFQLDSLWVPSKIDTDRVESYCQSISGRRVHERA